MALTEEERMDRAGSDKPLPKRGLPLHVVAKMQLDAGASSVAVANMLMANGWPTMKAKNFVNSYQYATGRVNKTGLVRGISNASSTSGAAPRSPGVKNLQRSLQSIGMEVKPTGVVDAATVTAINEVFSGWDDAPPKLRTGNLTAKQISSNLPVVAKYLHQAISGSKSFEQLDEG